MIVVSGFLEFRLKCFHLRKRCGWQNAVGWGDKLDRGAKEAEVFRLHPVVNSRKDRCLEKSDEFTASVPKLPGWSCLWGGWSVSGFGRLPAGESAVLAICSQSGRVGSGEPPGKVFSWIPVQAPRTLAGTRGHVAAGCVFDWLLDRSQLCCLLLSFWLFTCGSWEVSMATKPPRRYCDESQGNFCFLSSFLVTQRICCFSCQKGGSPSKGLEVWFL